MPDTKVNGISLHYESLGQGPPLLFIHGLGSSLRDWELQVEAFADQFRVITLDLRGHGKSDKPRGPYTIELFAHDVESFLKKTIKKPTHVVGLSMGGAVAFQLALSHPHLMRSMVITNMGAMMPVQTFAQKRFYYARLFTAAILGPREVGKHIARHVFPGPAMGPLRECMERRWSENPRRPYLSSLRALKNWDVMERLREITCPTLILHAEHDYTPLDHKKEVAARMQKATLMTLPGAHHVVNIEQPDAFNSLVMMFLKRQES